MSILSRHKPLALPPLVAALLALGACVAGQPAAPPLPAVEKAPSLTSADAEFIQKLNEMDVTQIALANIAETHAARSDIATLGATIVKDLTGNQDKLTTLVTSHAMTLTPKPSSANQTVIDRMQHVHGAAFDRRYVRYVSHDHAKMKPVLENEIASSRNSDLVKLANDTKTMLAAYEAQLK
jgi:putative membrane protein